MSSIDDRFDKLPTWLKEHIGWLEIRIKELESENSTLKEKESHNKSRIYVQPILQINNKFYLRDNDIVNFQLGNSDSIYEHAQGRIEKDHRRISLMDMVIKPIVTNVIEIHR